MDRLFKVFLIVTALAFALLAAYFGYRTFSEFPTVPDFYASILRIRSDGTQETGTYGFSFRDFSSPSQVDLRSKKIPGFPEDFFAQGFCSSGSETYVTWGRTGLAPESAKIFRMGSGVVSKIAESPEYRFRSCAFWNVGGRVFGAVTHGTGAFVVRDGDSRTERTYPIPREFSKAAGTGTILSHFLAFSDLDGDGIDEAYLTATTLFVSSGSGMREFWTVFRYSFTGWAASWTVSDVGLPQPSSARRLKATEFFGKKEILVLYEHAASDSVPKLYRFASESGTLVSRTAFEFPGHRECKTLSESAILPYLTVQVGCDHATLYVLKRSGDSFVLDRKTVFWDSAKTASAKSEPWGNYAIHAILAGDWNSDGKPDVAVAVNNDGIYLADFSKGDPTVWKIAFPKESDSSDGPYMVMDMAAAPTSR